MSRQACAVLMFCVGLTTTLLTTATRAASIATQTAVLPDTSTNFTAGTASVSPLVITKFDTMNNTRVLDSVDLSFHAKITDQFNMTFPTNGPSTITTSVATGNPTTPGPSITMYQPDGVTPLLSVNAPNDPNFLTRSITYNPSTSGSSIYGSSLQPTDPHYIAPAVTQATNTLHLTSASDLALFTGKGFIGLPVSAQAYSSFVSTSGNGFGKVTTSGTADVTVTYNWHAQTPAPQVTTPEPASVILWGLVGSGVAVAVRRRKQV